MTPDSIFGDAFVAPPVNDPEVPAQIAEDGGVAVGEAVYFEMPAPVGPSPVLLLGGSDPASLTKTWSISDSSVFFNGGVRFMAIQFDQPIDPASILPGVNFHLSCRDDPAVDPWKEVAFDFQYDEASRTVIFQRQEDAWGNRPPFTGFHYRIILAGNSIDQPPLRAASGSEGVAGAPLGFDLDHPAGRDFEINFALDDGNYGGKFDLTAGPAPAAGFFLIDILAVPILLIPAGNSGPAPAPDSANLGHSAPVTNEASATPATAPASIPTIIVSLERIDVSTLRLTLNNLDLQSGFSAFQNSSAPGSLRGFSPNLADPLSATPLGGISNPARTAEARSADRLDLGGFGEEEKEDPKLSGPIAPSTMGVWRHLVPAISIWVEKFMASMISLPTQAKGIWKKEAPLGPEAEAQAPPLPPEGNPNVEKACGSNTGTEEGSNTLGLAAGLALVGMAKGPGPRRASKTSHKIRAKKRRRGN